MANGFLSYRHTSDSSGERPTEFTSWAELTDGILVVHLSGELHLAGRDFVTASCLQHGQLVVHIDMAGLTSIDGDGYGGLVDARVLIERNGGSLTLLNATGQPLAFVTALGHITNQSHLSCRSIHVATAAIDPEISQTCGVPPTTDPMTRPREVAQPKEATMTTPNPRVPHPISVPPEPGGAGRSDRLPGWTRKMWPRRKFLTRIFKR